MITSFSSNRRQFLGQASCAAVSSIPVLNTLLNLSITEKLSAVTAPANGEYRALVCIFLSGGNDSFNMLVPARGLRVCRVSKHTLESRPRSCIAHRHPPHWPA